VEPGACSPACGSPFANTIDGLASAGKRRLRNTEPNRPAVGAGWSLALSDGDIQLLLLRMGLLSTGSWPAFGLAIASGALMRGTPSTPGWLKVVGLDWAAINSFEPPLRASETGICPRGGLPAWKQTP